jgi:hypothetical protein
MAVIARRQQVDARIKSAHDVRGENGCGAFPNVGIALSAATKQFMFAPA